MKLKFLFIVFVFGACQAKQNNSEKSDPAYLEKFTASQLIEDITALKLELENYHAGLYRYSSPADFEKVYQGIINDLKAEMNVLDYYRMITPFIASVNCGHTRYRLPETAGNKIKNNEKYLPFRVQILGEKVFIKETFDQEKKLKQGAEIIAINDYTIQQIRDQIFVRLPSDGFITSSKTRMWERDFSYLFTLFIEEGNQTFKIHVRDDNNSEIIEVRGVAFNNLLLPDSKDPYLSYRKLNNETGLLRIGTFGSGSINSRGQDYYEFLAETFLTMKEENLSNLIIDLRGNGGGDDNYGAKLISYLSPKPFGYFESIEVTEKYNGWGNVEEIDGKRYMTSHQALSLQQPAEDRFKGNTYILIDGFSFSTCADVATVAHHLDLATLVGEETGGGYDGNTSGNSKSFILPNTGITVRIPMWMYTTANLGHEYHGRGAIPHYQVEPSIEDVIKGEDVVLTYTLETIEKGDH